MTQSGKDEDKKEKEKQPAWRVVTENIECLAIAIVMALMLKFFLIEAYKIPTGSMQPTIMGNEEKGLFDRVLVNKFIYLLSEPERWDVIVFKYPLNQAKNYIKRLIGLPNEKVSIIDGDIHINDKIEKKPEAAIKAVLKQIFPTQRENETFKDYFQVKGNPEIKDVDHLVFSDSGTCATRRPIRSNYFDGYNPDYGIPRPRLSSINNNEPVGDVRLSFDVTLNSSKGAIQCRIEESGKKHIFFLRGKDFSGESRITTQPISDLKGDKKTVVWSHPELCLEANKSYGVVFTNIDDRLTIHLDGEEIAMADYDYAPDLYDSQTNKVEFGPVDCGAEIEDITLYRDIHYISGNTKEFFVPEGHYFALGDNTQNSADSRIWHSVVYTKKDGAIIKGDSDSFQLPPFSMRSGKRLEGVNIVDIYGDKLTIPASELKSVNHTSHPEHFIPEKLMLGKAMCVFWPIYPHFRWKLLR